MFRCYDKITLSAMGVYDRDGKQIYLSIPFPLKDDIVIPENVMRLSISEYHEGKAIYGYHDFNIYVGEVSTIDELIDREEGLEFNRMFCREAKIVEETVVYYKKTDNINEIVAILEPGDIVVETVEELKTVLKQISEEFSNIRSSVSKIRKLSYNSNN